jgi:hypothetical protein
LGEGDSETAFVGGEELVLLREIEKCEVRLRPLRCGDGLARGENLLREFIARREHAQQRLHKLRSNGHH